MYEDDKLEEKGIGKGKKLREGNLRNSSGFDKDILDSHNAVRKHLKLHSRKSRLSIRTYTTSVNSK